jgi:plasmid maintenance system antidote protein VapI
MDYTFELVGVSPILSFFNYQLDNQQKKQDKGAAYLGAYRCTLDAFIETVETVPKDRGWNLDRAVDTVINFWLNHPEQINLWKKRLEDAGRENLIVARLADLSSLRSEFEALFGSPLD